MRSLHTLQLIYSAMFIALVFLATLLLNIKLPFAANGGLVHLGSAMLFIIALLAGPKYAAIAGAFGMGLFDLVSGWTLWAPFTFLTRGAQAYVIGKIAWSHQANGTSSIRNSIAIIASLPIMVVGYYICEALLFNSWLIPLASIPGNFVQNGVGFVIAIPTVAVLRKTLAPVLKNI